MTAVAGLSMGIILLGRAQRETEAQRKSAVQERELATIMSREANARADSLRRRDYISRVNLANREFLDDNAGLGEQLLYGCPSNLRDWEWSHVQRLAHPELDTFVNADTHQRQDIWSLAFSPDGRRLVSGEGPWYQPLSDATAALSFARWIRVARSSSGAAGKGPCKRWPSAPTASVSLLGREPRSR